LGKTPDIGCTMAATVKRASGGLCATRWTTGFDRDATPEWRLAFEGRLDEAAQARVRGAVKTSGSVGDPDEAGSRPGWLAGSSVGFFSLGLVLLPLQSAIAVVWVRQFALGALPGVFGWFWVAVLLAATHDQLGSPATLSVVANE
jgi:hypothetical protein